MSVDKPELAITHTTVPRRSRFARTLRALTSPYYRYRHAKLLHSMRVGLAMLVSILATTGVNIPHGIWASVTVLVVIGGLQHHGNIRKKAVERAAGTLLGALIGLTLLAQLNLIGSSTLTYVLMSVLAGICAWYAIGPAGYVALLTAITMCIVAGHGDNTIDIGLWRTLNVLIGIGIALAFSFALPLHATYSWRYFLADNMRECARIYWRVASGARFSADDHLAAFLRMSDRLVKSRSLLPSVAKEIDVAQRQLEDIQRLHRSLLSAIEMMSTGAAVHADAAARALFARECRQRAMAVRGGLLAMARSLRFAGSTQFGMPGALPVADIESAPGGSVAPELLGPYWLNARIGEQVEHLREALASIEPNWNIERHARPLAQS